MAQQEHSNRPAAESIDRIWELAKSIRTCMLTTETPQGLRARPMSAHVLRDEHAIYFLDKAGSEKEGEIEANPEIVLMFADNGANKFITLHGTAKVSNDRAKIKQLWSAFYKTWWTDENDPGIRLITVTPEQAELWDGLNNIAASGAMLLSAITGAKPSLGDESQVRL